MSASPELTKAPHELSPWRIRVTGRVVESHGKKMASPSPSPSPSSPSAVRIILDTACQTPESKESRIPPISGSCPPPAPRKPKRTAVLCKRRLSELEVFKIEGEDLEKFFMPHSVIKKQKKQQDLHDDHDDHH
ncbi:hypothetical protein J5N97_028688 [Dioscorea zingiberensis]|uniref:Uncharacterized protein n=1 Tax=Dioscorea zingiberensis TaxID=325984 RepID=A0A9D5BZG4_9LILI|nr:hypothetical protein J5N97_028688 [Dioscorea zingiberensis]